VLRAYAAFLDVDVGAAPADEPVTQTPSQPSKPVLGLRILLLIAVGAPLLVALAYVVATALRDAGEGSSSDAQVTRASVARPEPRTRPRRKPPPAQPPVRLVLTARRGSSWVEARAGSATGSLLFQGTLADGRRIRLDGQRVWLRFGAASNVALTLNGKPAGADLQGTVEALVTPQGIRSA
jgi:hypothetical protein